MGVWQDSAIVRRGSVRVACERAVTAEGCPVPYEPTRQQPNQSGTGINTYTITTACEATSA